MKPAILARVAGFLMPVTHPTRVSGSAPWSSRPRGHRAARREPDCTPDPRANAAGEPTVLGLATGSTPIGVIASSSACTRRRPELQGRRDVQSDEYYLMPAESIHSYHRFRGEPVRRSTSPRQRHILPGVYRARDRRRGRRYENDIERAGGIDFLIPGIERRDTSASTSRSGSDSRARARHAGRRNAATPPPTSSARSSCRAKP